jgi:hypothetical protein
MRLFNQETEREREEGTVKVGEPTGIPEGGMEVKNLLIPKTLLCVVPPIMFPLESSFGATRG